MSPMVIKALFSSLGITPEQVLEPIHAALTDLAEFKQLALTINHRLERIEKHLNIDASSTPIEPLILEGSTNVGGEN